MRRYDDDAPLNGPELREVALRAHAVPVKRKKARRSSVEPMVVPEIGPSEWVLAFDTETNTDAAQQLRVGFYQLRRGAQLVAEGAFAELDCLNRHDRRVLTAFLIEAGLACISVAEFRQLLVRVLAERNGTLVGMNLPFDISRIGLGHAPAEGRGAGGFTFQLFEDPRSRHLQVRHLSQRAAFVRLSSRGVPAGSRRRRREWIEQHGHVVDVKTAAGAVHGRNFSLKALAVHLRTEHHKLDAGGEHGGPLTREYLTYARNDVQVTWECYAKLRDRYESYGLSTPLSRIYSAASLAKAVLREMGVRPLLERQPDFPPELLGKLMSTYHGGRAEVHERRVVKQVLYLDVHSEYPSVCILQSLWRFVIAERTESYDATQEVRSFLRSVRAEDLQRPETWRKLTAIVEVLPDDDVLPVRGRYDGTSYSIAVQHYTSEQPQWFTLADCVASTLRTSRAPRVLRAIGFRPVGVQPGLTPVDLLGKPEYRVDPVQDDLYRSIIDLRDRVKAEQKQAEVAGQTELVAELEAQQLALKELANSGSYGVFMELNVRRYARPRAVLVYGGEEKAFRTRLSHIEEPGRYFDPLLGTLITGAGRLLLMLCEMLGEQLGLGWMLCDTDSWCLSKPDGMTSEHFVAQAKQLQSRFDPLNPYAKPQPLFKLEDENYKLGGDGKPTGQLEPLFGYAVSAKRYTLCNLDVGKPVSRKVSAHGLGHLRAPYDEEHAPASIPPPQVLLKKLDVARWQYDLWYRIVEAALAGHPNQVDLTDLEGFDRPAASRYAATGPELLRWFDRWNTGRPYAEQVRPFGFMLGFQARGEADSDGEEVPSVVAPFDKDVTRAARGAFDRHTGVPVPADRLRTYREALAQYHLHPENKFLNGDYVDAGVTRRRHVAPLLITYIGKEANDWEVQYHLGLDESRSIDYGAAPIELRRLQSLARQRIRRQGVRSVSRAMGCSAGLLSMASRSKRVMSLALALRVLQADMASSGLPSAAEKMDA